MGKLSRTSEAYNAAVDKLNEVDAELEKLADDRDRLWCACESLGELGTHGKRMLTRDIEIRGANVRAQPRRRTRAR